MKELFKKKHSIPGGVIKYDNKITLKNIYFILIGNCLYWLAITLFLVLMLPLVIIFSYIERGE